MSDVSFDLTSQPWIPCETSDGAIVELSTRDALRRAHELRAIADPSPLITVALHRHLLAVLHRAYSGPKQLADWIGLYQSPTFDGARIDTYLDSVRDRMDIFHAVHPFAQVRGLAEQFEPDPIDMMTVERRSWGTARALFQHRPEGHRPSMTPGEAARALLAYHAFDTGGLVKKPGEPTSASAAPLTGCAVVLVRGTTLFETLTLNLLRYDTSQGQPIAGTSDDAPCWERDPQPRSLPKKSEPKRMPDGWLDQLTWLSRRIELVREGDTVVGFVRCVGQGFADEAWGDPMVAWKEHDKRGLLPVSIRVDRAFWRDSHLLFESGGNEGKRQRPKAIDQLALKKTLTAVPSTRRYTLEVGGLATSKSRVDFVRREALPTVAPLLAHRDSGEAIRGALDFAERAVGAMNGALYIYAKKTLAPGDREPDRKDVRGQLQSLGAEAAVWSELGARFPSFLQSLADAITLNREAPAADVARARDHFEKGCVRAAEDAFRVATASGERSPAWLKARAIAERNLRVGLSMLERTHPAEEVMA